MDEMDVAALNWRGETIPASGLGGEYAVEENVMAPLSVLVIVEGGAATGMGIGEGCAADVVRDGVAETPVLRVSARAPESTFVPLEIDPNHDERDGVDLDAGMVLCGSGVGNGMERVTTGAGEAGTGTETVS